MNIESARNDIKIFVRNILAEIAHRAGSQVLGELPDHRQSSFGRWYEDAGKVSFGQIPAFQEIANPYAALYLTSRGIRAAVQSGDRDEALRQGADLSRIEQELLGKLDELSTAIDQKKN
jgi:hypothetical protein